jgi:16S rRNA (adenine1518-N6/adenine1519-N6)-dimethyltransferase
MYAQKMKGKENQYSRDSEPETKVKFEHKRSLGQNFLTSDIVPGWMVEASDISSNDTVLEIGPGTGMLTKAILAKAGKVIAVEADQRAIDELNLTFAREIKTGRLIIHHGDAREITPDALGLKDHSFKVVANIPYYLSGFLLRNFLETKIQPSTLTFLIQKELAFRIVRDKKESLLSLSVKAFGNPKYSKTVGRGHFNPIPKVDSAILTIHSINRDRFTDLDTNLFFEILHLGLGKKRKQLLANLTEKYPREFLETTFSKIGLEPKVRGEDLKLETWFMLIKKLDTDNPQPTN